MTNMDSDTDNDDYEDAVIAQELLELGLDDEHFSYCLDHRPSEVFSEDKKLLVFTLTHTCYCYEGFEPLKDKKIYIYVKANANEPITYGQIFGEICSQVEAPYKELAEKYDMEIEDIYCNHNFVEALTQNTDIEYDIWCGS